MKVAIATPEFVPNWGGVGTYAALLAKNLPSEFDVHIISLSRGEGPVTAEDRDILDRVTLHSLGTAKDTFIYNSQFQYSLWRKFDRMQSECHFDLVHANHAQMPDLFLRMFGTQVPSITTIHTTIRSQRMGSRNAHTPISSLERSEKMTYLLYPFLTTVEQLYLNRCSHFIFVSEFIKRLFESRLTPPPNSRVIHNGVDTSMFRPRSEGECIERFPMLDGKENIILYSGRLLAMKGLDTVVRAFSRVVKDADAHLVIAGAGKFEPWRRMLLDSGVPEDAFTCLFQVPYTQMPYLYPLASVFVLPSYTESFPMTALEAMASATPVVASDVGGIPEMIASPSEGMLVAPGDSDGVAKALLNFVCDKELARTTGERARRKVAEEFSSQAMALRTADSYRMVLGGGG